MMHWSSWGAGEWLLMSLAMLLFWALVVAGVIALVRGSVGQRQEGGGSAEQLLDERFARGEIDVEEYRRRRELLRQEEGRVLLPRLHPRQ